ncbi:MAG TPA: serine hydrolase [Novosphingobium sp.]|nr:serine hydrolase [Novosphingobium sp.]
MKPRTVFSPLLAAAVLCNVPVARAEAPRSAEARGPDHTAPSPAMRDLLDYARGQRTTGFLVIQDGAVLVERNWPAPAGDRVFAAFAYEQAADGALLEDVASQQKSFVSVLVAIAVDKGLVDVAKPVSAYLGAGWSKAAAEQEARIRVLDILTMSSGLDEQFAYVAPPGTRFFYNTPIYAVTKRILEAASRQPLEAITRDWLTAPAGMKDTAWRKRPAALSGVGNATGLVTTPRDIAAFGRMILAGGVGPDGRRVVSKAGLDAMLTPSATNPAYGRLWWLNGSAYTMRATGRQDGPLVTAAPRDMVAALGALDRRLYLVPSRKLIVVRTGASAIDADFDQQLWLRIVAALPR